jgi:hypothetical protein
MWYRFRIRRKDAARFIRRLDPVHRVALEAATKEMATMIAERTPVDTGAAKRSFTYHVSEIGKDKLFGKIYTTAFYLFFLNYGTKSKSKKKRKGRRYHIRPMRFFERASNNTRRWYGAFKRAWKRWFRE